VPPEVFDYVLKLEELENGLNQMFSTIVPGWTARSYGNPHPSELVPKVTNATEKVGDFYTASMKSIVQEVYRADFESFKYSTGEPVSP
jgi:hypothetical protein